MISDSGCLRVCYFGTYRADYSRNRIMIEGLRCAGIDVVECHEELWHGIDDRVEVASGGWLRPRFWWRTARAYGRLIWRYRTIGSYDVMVVGYPGQMDVYLARMLSWLSRKPLTWDVFMSIYLIALERGLGKRSPLTLRLLRLLEKIACHLPDLLILDTDDYVCWFGTTHGISPARFRLVPTGADDRIFRPGIVKEREDSIFRVVYYGTFIPNHGVHTIVEAAYLLRDDPAIQFELVGTGPDREGAMAVAQTYKLANVTFVAWLDQTELVRRVMKANICLGVFGTTPQSMMTVQNKIYEGLAMAKPVISGDSDAVRKTLRHGEHIYLCRRADPHALAEAILTLRDDRELCARLSQNGYSLYSQRFTSERLGRQYSRHLRSLTRAEPK